MNEEEVLSIGVCPCGESVSDHQVTRQHLKDVARYQKAEKWNAELIAAIGPLDSMMSPTTQIRQTFAHLSELRSAAQTVVDMAKTNPLSDEFRAALKRLDDVT